MNLNLRRLGRFYKGSATHYLMLLKCIQATEGGVLEMGTGLFSTPFLHWLCSEKQRRLISYEDNYDFYRLARIFQNRFHRIRLVEDWDKLDIGGHWSVALIDNSTKYRASMAIALKDKVDYVVMHDTNDPVHYRYQYVWSHFKYRYDDTRQSPWTSVVSNFENLKWLEEKIL